MMRSLWRDTLAVTGMKGVNGRLSAHASCATENGGHARQKTSLSITTTDFDLGGLPCVKRHADLGVLLSIGPVA